MTRRQCVENLNILLIRYAQSLVMGAYSYSQDPGGVSRYRDRDDNDVQAMTTS